MAQPMALPMEFVFVLPRFTLFPDRALHGLAVFGEAGSGEGTSWNGDAFDRAVKEHGFFVERDHAERTPALKQVIPYTLVHRGGEFMLLRRTKGGGEARLHDKLSLGVGGHVNPVDAVELDASGGGDGGASATSVRAADPLPAATRREVMEEELEVTGRTRLVRVGLINDDSNAVGAVHVGLVQVLDLIDGDARVREVDVLQGSFVTPDELRARLDDGANFETWSSLILERFDDVLACVREDHGRKEITPTAARQGSAERSRAREGAQTGAGASASASGRG